MNHFLHLLGAQELAETLVVDAGIVRGNGDVLDAARLDRVNQPLRDAAQAEPASSNRHSVEQKAVESFFGAGIDLLHPPLLGPRLCRSRG